MSFDLSNVLATASAVSKNGSSSSSEEGSKYRYLYPSTGTLRVKLLYNPKSNLLGRITKKHVIDKSKAICLSMYNMDCPICKTVQNIKNAIGQDVWKFNARVRAVTFAQYVGSNNYQWTQENPEPKVGDVVILMYPWSVYQDINRLLVNCGANASQLIATNVGKVVNISRWQESSMTKYKCEVDAFAPEFKSAESDEAFEALLNSLPSLEEVNCPPAVTDEIIKTTNEVAEALSREYLKTSAPTQPVQVSSAFSQQSNFGSSRPSASSGVPSAKDYPCIGNYNPSDPKCVACLKGVACKLFSDSNPSSDSIPY